MPRQMKQCYHKQCIADGVWLTQTMEFAADAIRGHKSAHSLATGPVIADPAQCYSLSFDLASLRWMQPTAAARSAALSASQTAECPWTDHSEAQ